MVDAAGGPLEAEALVARNLTRELEMWLPFQLLWMPDALFPGAAGWVRLAAALWLVIVSGLPLFHPQGARLGDLLAGTRVVRAPSARLLGELGPRGR